MKKLDGKVCLITGGAGSLGAAAARLFIEQGAAVVLVDRDAERLNEVARDLPQERVATIVADVASAEGASAYVDLTLARFGAIDVLFSNAGNFGTVQPIADYPDDVFGEVLSVHVRGAYLAAKHATPHMRKGGSIVITSSVAGVRGDAGVYAYITAKHAQVGLMRCLAKELAPRGIRVNTIHPGPIDNGFQLAVERRLGDAMGVDGTAFFNDMIPLGRHGTADEIARSVLYLASDDSSFVTGTTLMVDGGMSV
ncbi:MAG: SDR family oxidoreductase [Aquamicrobium sp.]|nr:SDR family oxidoreductase [Aquamicrobium sp.]